MISAARSNGARSEVLEQITHNARGAIIDVYTAWEWPALCEAVSCLKVDPDRLPAGNRILSYRKQETAKKHVGETALPTGKIEREATQGRVDVEDVPTAQTLGTLAREVLSSSGHAESRELARVVLRLLAGPIEQSRPASP